MMAVLPGSLYIVATPIGNLGDFSLRAQEVLSQVDSIAAEDTRHSKKLLQHYHILKPMLALHDHNENEICHRLIDKLLQGQSIALISDAGTPLISDPGYTLVRTARNQGITVIPIPGCSALISALSVSGLPSDRFSFFGFLAKTQAKRQKQLAELSDKTETLIFYESCHRLVPALEDMVAVMGQERECFIAREMTKLYESYLTGSISQLLKHYKAHPKEVAGEVVIIVAGKEPQINELTDVSRQLMKIIMKDMPVKVAVKITAELTGIKKKILYDYALTQKNQS